MKRFRYLLPLLLLALLPITMAAQREDQWKQVEEAMRKGLPKTAIERLEPIIAAALAEKDYPEAILAIGRKIALEGNIQGNKPEEKITRMEAEIAKAPAEMRPVMQAILAHWYWQYFQRNRWRFLQRTQTAEPPGEDFTTWDLPRLFREIDKHLVAAMAQADVLQKIPVAKYDELLVKGNMPDKYRPTLYDFLAQEALAFYNSGEQAAAQPSDAFVLSAGSPIFSPVADFLAWKIETTDADSAKVKAIRLYQTLLRFHEKDDDRSAWLDVDLARLEFGANHAAGEEKNARYKAELKRWSEQHANHPLSARADHLRGTVLQAEGDLVAAHGVASAGKRRYPDSVGGRRCHNLIEQIEAPSVQINTERVWNEPLPEIHVKYKNVTKVYLRAVKYDWEKLLGRGRRPEHLDDKERKALLARKPDLAWSVDLPATDDYQQRSEAIAMPKKLAPGFYFLVASHDEGFTAKNNQVTFTDIWVSDLALVIRSRQGEAVLDGFVLDANSGEPLPEAEVKAWRNENNRWVAIGTTRSDENGLFRFKAVQRRAIVVLARHKDQVLSSGNQFYLWQQDRRARPFTRTLFFTDRSLYRPGQTVRYKGICIEVDHEKDDYRVMPRQSINVVFNDPNGKEIEGQQQRTNDYGSFNGSFTAPRDRLMGRMAIVVKGGPPGGVNFNVDEYKRPKFRVTLDKPKEAARLGAEVKLIGKAEAYTGAAIDGAKVRWRVVRQVQYPIWWRWCFWWRSPQTQSQEIAQGTATTGADGKFEIDFIARPDPTVSEEDEPIFRFTVSADVTDTAGETRSASQTINVGFTALQASLTASDWQTAEKPVEIAIRTTTLDGEPQVAEGSVKVYRLVQPDEVARARWFNPPMPLRGGKPAKEPEPDPANMNSWRLGEMVDEQGFTTDAEGNAKLSVKLPTGPYRAMLATQDRFGKPVTARLPITVIDPGAKRLDIKIANLFQAPEWSLEPGAKLSAVWGSGYKTARAFVEIEHRRKVVESYWTPKGRTQVQIVREITEAMRGGFTLRVTLVRENRAYLNVRRVNVPWSNKNLELKWEHFVSKLAPAQKETWTLIIKRREGTAGGKEGLPHLAEMVAGLYDASLDAYLPHRWQQHFGVFRQDRSNLQQHFENSVKRFHHLQGNWPRSYRDATMTYRSLPMEIIANLWGYRFFGQGKSAWPPPAPAPRFTQGAMRMGGGRRMMMAEGMAMPMDAAAPAADAADLESAGEEKSGRRDKLAQAGSGAGGAAGPPAGPDLSQVSARTNLNETAFFFPHLVAGEKGEVKFEFTMPEALTEWRFMGFAHDRELRGGYLEGKTVTAKDLMVQPNPPRFLREGDVLEFTVKVSNQSAARQAGTVRLTLADARTASSVDAALGNKLTDLPFDIPSKESRSYSWRLAVPDGMGFLTYKTVASTGKLSDGEEGYLPVLSRRILVTESLPLPIRGAMTKAFEFTKLRQSGKSDTLRHQSLTVQMVSNPSWYAVMALPYLMEYPHQCAEQVFNRLYANSLARHIANSDPKIRRVFDQWKGTPALDSPLEKNQDLKSVMLEETPWLRQSDNESQARRNVGILFDDNRLNSEMARALRQLSEMQRPDGAWPWFPGGPANDYITLYITTGFGRLRHLGVDVEVTPAVKALGRLDGWIDRIYRNILKHGNKEKYNLSPTIALYLYGRSFFLEDKPVDAKHREAVDYFLGQSRKYWLKLANRQSQGHLALALKRFGDKETPTAIMDSIRERSVTDEELGMFWRELEFSWWWYRAPIETQAIMIEAFDEVVGDAEAVEDCKVWLLKQKQTQDWKTTKATADAVYALLLRGSDLLASDALVEVALGGVTIEPENVEAGTGFYEQRFAGPEIKPKLGQVKVTKVDEGVAWGALHWQYLEEMSKVTPYEGTPLTLTKKLFTKVYTKKGPELVAVDGPLEVGDELVVRVVLRTDRDMEYIHLKDQRGSGTEPVNVLSRYKYQDGLAYYESTRDTASHFFIDYLPKGTYVFEYSTRVVHKGAYQTGMASIQCMYAPEFNSHSESFALRVE